MFLQTSKIIFKNWNRKVVGLFVLWIHKNFLRQKRILQSGRSLDMQIWRHPTLKVEDEGEEPKILFWSCRLNNERQKKNKTLNIWKTVIVVVVVTVVGPLASLLASDQCWCFYSQIPWIKRWSRGTASPQLLRPGGVQPDINPAQNWSRTLSLITMEPIFTS